MNVQAQNLWLEISSTTRAIWLGFGFTLVETFVLVVGLLFLLTFVVYVLRGGKRLMR